MTPLLILRIHLGQKLLRSRQKRLHNFPPLHPSDPPPEKTPPLTLEVLKRNLRLIDAMTISNVEEVCFQLKTSSKLKECSTTRSLSFLTADAAVRGAGAASSPNLTISTPLVETFKTTRVGKRGLNDCCKGVKNKNNLTMIKNLLGDGS